MKFKLTFYFPLFDNIIQFNIHCDLVAVNYFLLISDVVAFEISIHKFISFSVHSLDFLFSFLDSTFLQNVCNFIGHYNLCVIFAKNCSFNIFVKDFVDCPGERCFSLIVLLQCTMYDVCVYNCQLHFSCINGGF